jgi:hypothetical protein
LLPQRPSGRNIYSSFLLLNNVIQVVYYVIAATSLEKGIIAVKFYLQAYLGNADIEDLDWERDKNFRYSIDGTRHGAII